MRTKTKIRIRAFIGYLAFCLTITALEQVWARNADPGLRLLILCVSLGTTALCGALYWLSMREKKKEQ